MSQLATWRVMIGKGVSLHGPLTYFYQSQLAMWRVVAQSCVPSIIHMEFQSRIISTIVMIGQEVLSSFGSSKAWEETVNSGNKGINEPG